MFLFDAALTFEAKRLRLEVSAVTNSCFLMLYHHAHRHHEHRGDVPTAEGSNTCPTKVFKTGDALRMYGML